MHYVAQSEGCNFRRRIISNILRASVACAALGAVAHAYGQWTEQVLKSLDAQSGTTPRGPLMQGKDGVLYGLTEDGSAFKLNCDGSGFTKLHVFSSQDGRWPQGGLMQGVDGALYGTTFVSGSNGLGTVFKMNPDGSHFVVLHAFPATATDGSRPGAGVLVQDKDGAIYGTTCSGGAYDAGVVFKISPDGSNYTVLHSFTKEPYYFQYSCGVIVGADGLLYGASPSGGTYGSGKVYKLNPDGSGYAVIHSFGEIDYSQPYCQLIQGPDGALYGTIWTGVFKINPDGTGFRILHNLYSSDDNPHDVQAGLVLGADGCLYGTGKEAAGPGGIGGQGGVFAIKPDGTGYAVVHRFTDNNPYGGAHPEAALIQGRDGSLYGTTTAGGAADGGTVFRLAPPPPPQVGSPRVFPDGRFTFSLTVPSGQGCRVDVSTNLTDWNTLTNVASGTNWVQVIDGSASTATRRFYRATSPR